MGDWQLFIANTLKKMQISNQITVFKRKGMRGESLLEDHKYFQSLCSRSNSIWDFSFTEDQYATGKAPPFHNVWGKL